MPDSCSLEEAVVITVTTQVRVLRALSLNKKWPRLLDAGMRGFVQTRMDLSEWRSTSVKSPGNQPEELESQPST